MTWVIIQGDHSGVPHGAKPRRHRTQAVWARVLAGVITLGPIALGPIALGPIALGLCMPGCSGDDEFTSVQGMPGAAPGAASPKGAGTAPKAAGTPNAANTANGEGAGAASSGVDPADFELTESRFLESERQRDPFRAYVDVFRGQLPEGPQRAVLLPETSIDEMRIIAIISGIPAPRAMLVDRIGVGHTVRQGDYVGRPEIVRVSGAEDVSVLLNWRVESIRAHAMVITREDPTSPNKVPKSRTLALYEVENESGI